MTMGFIGLLLLPLVVLPATKGSKVFTSVGKIKDAIYEEQKYVGGLYKLLSRDGPIGSSGPEERVRAPLVLLEDINTVFTEDRAVLVPSQMAQAYLAHLQADPAARAHVTMVLVFPDEVPESDSGETHFPQGGAQWAPYGGEPGAAGYVWNPAGEGTVWGHTLGVPVFLLQDKLGGDVRWRAQYNMKNGFKHGLQMAESWLHMWADQSDSEACLKAGTCQGIGGFNVWAALPPLPFNATTKQPMRSGKPVTLVVANVDANGLFHDSVQAASTLTGVIAMIAAMDVLRAADKAGLYTRQLVFVALSGDPWDYMASRRLSWDVHRGTPHTQGLHWDDIDQVIELGPLGRALDPPTNTSTLYLHTQPPGGRWGDASQLRQAFMDAAAISPEAPLTATPASEANPGLPPSSLYSFLRAKPSLAGVYVAEFDSQYINPYYASSYNNASFISTPPVTAAAVALARTLHALGVGAGAGADAKALEVDAVRVGQVVSALVQCMAQEVPGMACPTARDLINPDYQITDSVVSYGVKHYIGVLQYIHPDPQDPYYKKTVYRFLWNLMGRFAAQGEQGAPCAFQTDQCPAGQECIGWKGSSKKKNPARMGHCWRTTVRYAPSLSTSLDFIPNARGPAKFFLTNASAEWDRAGGWPRDPLWAESYWPVGVPLVQVKQTESPTTEKIVLAVGVVATVAVGALSYYGRLLFEKHLKAQ